MFSFDKIKTGIILILVEFWLVKDYKDCIFKVWFIL